MRPAAIRPTPGSRRRRGRHVGPPRPPARGRGRPRTATPRARRRKGRGRDVPARRGASGRSVRYGRSSIVSASEPTGGVGVGHTKAQGGRCRRGLGDGPVRPGSRRSGRGPGFLSILRKEVIQPQVPLRLPCYDLVPITGFIFGACLAAPATSDAPRFGGLTGGVYKAQEHIHRGMLIRDY